MKRKCSRKKEKTRRTLLAVLTAALLTAGSAVLIASGFQKYPGDANLDRQIDVADGVLIARYCVEDASVLITEEGLANADADGDGEVSGSDTVCVLKMIAALIPMPKNPYDEPHPDTQPAETTALPAETAAQPAETTAPPAETTAPPAETSPVTAAELEQTDAFPETTGTVSEPSVQAEYLTADGKAYPLGVSVSVLSCDVQPVETLTVNYQAGNIIFAVFAEDQKQTMIAFAFNDDIFGYYILCSAYQAPEGYTVTEMRDRQKNDTLYAVLVQKDGISISFPQLKDHSDTQVLSKLAYYATNGIRALNGLDNYIWDEEVAKVAMQHSVEMAENDYFDHKSLDGSKFSKRLLDYGIDWQACAENIDYGYPEPFSAVNGWFNSETGHRENILSTEYQYIGAAFASNGQEPHRFYGTQDFYKGWD